ncbi:Rsa4 protein [Saccharomycopsis crataegensis]|uniref:Rsa4 protein n=1 Tax=Saccharomycopsis crataegensis TaxID=43959 RepID=A0AAV5QWM3_9ASCO|nr:Rsa4 protein [Saccharomycopsis crataegensis]
MSTILPPPSKKQKKALQSYNTPETAPGSQTHEVTNITVSFKSSETGESLGGTLRVPSNINQKQLEKLINQLNNSADDPVPYEFAVVIDEKDQSVVDIRDNLYDSVIKPGTKTTEDHLKIIYTPQSVFKVKPITRSSFAIAGHGATILTAKFSPISSSRMVTGSGDSTAKIWDCDTQTPFKTLSGHSNWVLTAEYSPDGQYIATGSMDNNINIWNANTGELLGTLSGHSKWITSISWKPLHLLKAGEPLMLVSASKDSTLKVWNVEARTCTYSLSGHKSSVSCVKWGGYDTIYSTSHDKTIMMWNPNNGTLIKTLKSHAHWINHLSLSTDYLLRKGPYTYNEPENRKVAKLPINEKITIAKKIFQSANPGDKNERMVTASDDFTMYLWSPFSQNKPLGRMHGHQKLVNHVAFSPNGKYIVSASFDNSVKLWDGKDGKFLATFRGHVGPVYQVCWSSDNRLLVSGSKDTTLKVWDVRTRKLAVDLPGHKDEVYAVDWSTDGRRVVSGGKDKMVRIWTH